MGEWSNITDILLNFTSNIAHEAGTVLYGGSLELCRVQENGQQVQLDTFDFVQALLGYPAGDEKRTIASDPRKVCFCYGNLTDCSERSSSVTVKRGQHFFLPVITVGQFDTPVRYLQECGHILTKMLGLRI